MVRDENGQFKLGRFLDVLLRVLAAVSVAVCGAMFTYAIKVEAKISEYDTWIKGENKFYSEHRELHSDLNREFKDLTTSLHGLITDVRVIQGNRFTANDGQDMLKELNRLTVDVAQIKIQINELSESLKRRSN